MNYFFVRSGSILAGGGIIWATYRATDGLVLGNDPVGHAAAAVLAQQGPLEVCAIGILLWLAGKWRMHTAIR